jgi:hypothetical protein
MEVFQKSLRTRFNRSRSLNVSRARSKGSCIGCATCLRFESADIICDTPPKSRRNSLCPSSSRLNSNNASPRPPRKRGATRMRLLVDLLDEALDDDAALLAEVDAGHAEPDAGEGIPHSDDGFA